MRAPRDCRTELSLVPDAADGGRDHSNEKVRITELHLDLNLKTQNHRYPRHHCRGKSRLQNRTLGVRVQVNSDPLVAVNEGPSLCTLERTQPSGVLHTTPCNTLQSHKKREKRTVAVVRQKMKKTRAKEQIAGPRVNQNGVKNGHETLREHELGACRARVRHGSPVSRRPARAGPRGGTRNFNFLQLAAGPSKRPACRESIQQQVASQRPDNAVRLVTPCPRPPAAVEDHLTKSPAGDTEERQAKLCTVAVRFLGARCIQKDPSSPIQKLASKTRTIIAPTWLRNWAHRVSKDARHQTCTQKPRGCASLLLLATLGLRIHWGTL